MSETRPGSIAIAALAVLALAVAAPAVGSLHADGPSTGESPDDPGESEGTASAREGAAESGSPGGPAVDADGLLAAVATVREVLFAAAPVAVAAAAIAVVAAAAVVGRRDGATEADRPPDGADAAAETPTGRSESGPIRSGTEATNEVYRTWLALVDRLESADGSDTPVELREKAIRAGLDRDAVSELTALFRRVRYGAVPATGTENRRARSIRERLRDRDGGDRE